MKILENISLAQLCTFGIGGNARYLINIKTKQDLLDAVEFADKLNLPIFILGGGSNIVLPDEGINGVVCRMMNNQISSTETEIEIESGATHIDFFTNHLKTIHRGPNTYRTYISSPYTRLNLK